MFLPIKLVKLCFPPTKNRRIFPPPLPTCPSGGGILFPPPKFSKGKPCNPLPRLSNSERYLDEIFRMTSNHRESKSKIFGKFWVGFYYVIKAGNNRKLYKFWMQIPSDYVFTCALIIISVL